MLKLYIGNKNYSSWSMRPWVLMTQAGIPFEEVVVRFDSFDADSRFKAALAGVSPTGKVPVLVDGELVVWDTLAIAEYLAEQYPELHLWPREADRRAPARAASRRRGRRLRRSGRPCGRRTGSAARLRPRRPPTPAENAPRRRPAGPAAARAASWRTG